MNEEQALNILNLPRELITRTVEFQRARKKDEVPRPKNVINLNPLRRRAGDRGVDAYEARPTSRPAGEFGVAPPGHDDEDPLYAPPEAVLTPREKVPPNEWPVTRAASVGLHNRGNTCFMNSVLQALAYVPPLNTLFNQLNKSLRNGDRSSIHSAVLQSMTEVVRQLSEPGRNAISPSGIVSVLPKLLNHRHFRPGQQADAHEFAIRVLDVCHEALMRKMANGRKLSALAEQTSPVMRIVGGFLCSQVSWRKVDEARSLQRLKKIEKAKEVMKLPGDTLYSRTYEPSMILHLPVVGRSLDDCMNRFCAPDEIDGYKTPRDAPVVVQRATLLHRLPKVMIVHLKRFDNRMRKVSRPIAFDAEWDVKRYCTPAALEAPQSTRYELASIVCHHGHGLGFGHYTAYVKAANKLWYHCDDSHVSHVKEPNVFRAEAYMLCYVQKQVAPPPRNSAPSPALRPAEADFGTELAEDAVLRASIARRVSEERANSAPTPQRATNGHSASPERSRRGSTEMGPAPAPVAPTPLCSRRTQELNEAAKMVSPAATPMAPPAAPAPPSDMDSDEEPIDDRPIRKHRAEDGVQQAPAAVPTQRHAKRGVLASTKVHQQRDTEEAENVVAALRAEASEQPDATRKKAFEGTFRTATRDDEYERAYDHGHLKKTKAERREAAIAKGRIVEHDGRNQFQEVQNVRRVKQQRQEDWMNDAQEPPRETSAFRGGSRGGRGGRGSGGRGFGGRGRSDNGHGHGRGHHGRGRGDGHSRGGHGGRGKQHRGEHSSW